MSLINTDVLKAWIENWFVKNSYYHPYSKSNNIPIPELYDILERIPAVDAEPVRHGHWKFGDDLYENAICSCCEWDSGEPMEYPKNNFFFCPNCGSKMDEVIDDGQDD